MSGKTRNQGEGNREAAKHYNDRTRRFVESGRVDKAAREAREMTAEEREEAKRAERAGKRRAKDLDPSEKRDYSKGSK